MPHECTLDDLIEPCYCHGYHCQVCHQRFSSYSLDARCKDWTVCEVVYGGETRIFPPREDTT